MLKRGEKIHDLSGLLEALYLESGPGSDRGVHSIVVEDYPGKTLQVCVRFSLEGNTPPDELVPLDRALLIEAFEKGYVERVGRWMYGITLKGREERNRRG